MKLCLIILLLFLAAALHLIASGPILLGAILVAVFGALAFLAGRNVGKWVVLLTLISSIASAADVTLGWDANAEPDLASYTVYEKLPTTGLWIIVGTVSVPPEGLAAPTFIIRNFSAPITRTFAVSATNVQGLESGLSNELALRTPGQPKNLRVVK